jgi:hypothetical protein
MNIELPDGKWMSKTMSANEMLLLLPKESFAKRLKRLFKQLCNVCIVLKELSRELS